VGEPWAHGRGNCPEAHIQPYISDPVLKAFQADLLAACGRSHSLADVEAALADVAAAAPRSWSLDLISGAGGNNESTPRCSAGTVRADAATLEPGPRVTRGAEKRVHCRNYRHALAYTLGAVTASREDSMGAQSAGFAAGRRARDLTRLRSA